MGEMKRILILSPDSGKGESLRKRLEEVGWQARFTPTPGGAVKILKEESADLIIVDTQLQNPPVGLFLEKSRVFLPQLLRLIWNREPQVEMNWPELINQAMPAAVLPEDFSLETLQALTAHQRKLIAALAPASAPSSSPNLTKTDRQVDSRKVQEQLRAKLTPKKKEPEPDQVQRAMKFPKNEELYDITAAKKSEASRQAENKPEENWEKGPYDQPPQHENSKLELDLMQDDMVSEVARVLDLLLEEPDVKLPVLPQVANEVRKLLAQEDVPFERIADTVALDPSMSARLLEVANSPLYSGKERTKNLQQAVSRIGMRDIRNMLLAVSAENLFAVGDRRLMMLMAKLWMHSLGCAYANEIMAQDLYIEESQDFFMMGLLHDIGKLLILHLIQQGYDRKLWTKKTITDELLEEVLKRRHNAMGARLLLKWEYDQSFQDVVYLHNDPDGQVCQYEEPVVVTYYSNLLTRKMGFSLLPYPSEIDPLGRHDIAQALNMSPDVRNKVEAHLQETIKKIQESYQK